MSHIANAYSTVQYVLDEVREHGASPTWWKSRFLHRIAGGLWFRRVEGNTGEYVMAKDWDNLLVLDACRFDLYRDVANPNCGGVRSRGASTPEWVAENFEGRSFPDTVYVTANPYVSTITDDEFHARYDVWEEGWDDGEGTVLPEVLAERSREIAAAHPDKRLIVHFMQPHQPFVGSDLPGSFWNVDESPWDALQRGTIDRSAVLEAYADNLRVVYPVAKELGLDIPGKSVLTADHGNMLGERVWPFPVRDYGHRKSIYTPENVRVPWDELPFETRKAITAGDTMDESELTADVTDRLADLGYVS
jgi:hypothetical protein